VEITIDVHVAAPVAPMIVEFVWLDPALAGTLPPVHENLGEPSGFLGGKFLPERRKQVRVITTYDKKHSGHVLSIDPGHCRYVTVTAISLPLPRRRVCQSGERRSNRGPGDTVPALGQGNR
jgi:hypothetical protein